METPAWRHSRASARAASTTLNHSLPDEAPVSTQTIQSYIDQNQERFLSELMEFLRIPASPRHQSTPKT